MIAFDVQVTSGPFRITVDDQGEITVYSRDPLSSDDVVRHLVADLVEARQANEKQAAFIAEQRKAIDALSGK